MNRLRFSLLFTSSIAALAFACGGISDPTLKGTENVATVSGALTGTTVPANARVALVYRKITPSTGSGNQASVVVGTDVPVVDGKFTMNLGVPAADTFSAVDGHSFRTTFNESGSTPPSVSGGETAVPDPAPAPAPAGGAGGAAARLAPRDLVGGQITEALSAAVAGFIVYADTNGNGKLDLEGEYASSPDQILGGNKELVLVYLQNGGALDYEKMRDKSGILPVAGFNLAWTEGRWFPLNVVDLKLSADAKLPSPVCASDYAGGSSGSGGVIGTSPAEEEASPSGGTSGSNPTSPYPSPADPALHCAPDGRSFSYDASASCPPSPPPPVGLCAGSGYDVAYPTTCAGVRYSTSLQAGQPVPDGWPCPTAIEPADGGPAPDGGPINDAGAGPG